MPKLDRRKLLHAGIAFAVPIGGVSLLSGCQQPTENAKNNVSSNAGETDESVARWQFPFLTHQYLLPLTLWFTPGSGGGALKRNSQVRSVEQAAR